ncbi:glycosyltransferase [Helicobacter jaachi]|uniref:Glycosyltransferase n=1 Tax=Helicobacter jaachi TaxID=1677920 RepID=A0A4U8T8X6_9HELI|nr:glycosyltransferase [Helicobacter jaachi]TLD96181.1 glycosyltransferase [Helicobacter jaachi]
MRILHLVTQDNGGAGRACVRLHKALLEIGADSIILTQHKTLDLPSIQQFAHTKLQKLRVKLRSFLTQLPLMLYPKREKDIFSPHFTLFPPRNRALVRQINALKPDVVHLHWIEGGFLNVKDLAYIQAPLLWSLHDANPYTGGCHYVAAACIGVSVACKKCPLLKSQSAFDISFLTFKHKAKVYARLKHLTINGLSRWITQCAKDSMLLGSKPIINLPNPIDTKIFYPINKHTAREILKIEKKTKFISFGALNATSTPRKGFSELKSALQILPDSIKQQCELLIFGASCDESENPSDNLCGIKTRYLGVLNDDISLVLLYSASDVFVTPSHAESFGQTALEALACGTPVVSFDTSGLKDIVLHRQNGYLAKMLDIKDLARGIEWILSLNKSAYETMAQNARQSAQKRFSASSIAHKYMHTYAQLTGGGAVDKWSAKALLIAMLAQKKEHFYIGFGALGGGSVARKGFKELKAALQNLSDSIKERCTLLVCGGYTESIAHIETKNLGLLHDDTSLALVYNACDVFIQPSLAENLSNVIMESLACGTPVVAFDIGGNADMISHKVNGYLAQALDTKDLARGIEWILTHADYNMLANNARQSVMDKFQSSHIAKKYLHTYSTLIESNGGGVDTKLKLNPAFSTTPTLPIFIISPISAPCVINHAQKAA